MTSPGPDWPGLSSLSCSAGHLLSFACTGDDCRAPGPGCTCTALARLAAFRADHDGVEHLSAVLVLMQHWPATRVDHVDVKHHLSSMTAAVHRKGDFRNGSKAAYEEGPVLLRVSDAGRSQRCGLHRGRRPKAFNEGTRGKWQAVAPRAPSAMEVCARRRCVRVTDADECVG